MTIGSSEVQLCDGLRSWGESLGFVVYPEVDGWDLVFVAQDPPPRSLTFTAVRPGDQIGIHAKLRANCEVLMQAAPIGTCGPTFPCVAAPEAGEAFRFVARRLGIGVITTQPTRKEKRRAEAYRRYGHHEDAVTSPVVRYWPMRSTLQPLALPPVASRSIVAGCPSPRVLSVWRSNAIRFVLFAKRQPYVTVADLRRFELGPSWVQRWLEPDDWATAVSTKTGKTVRVRTYVLTTKEERLPTWGYQDVTAELEAAEAAKAVRG